MKQLIYYIVLALLFGAASLASAQEKEKKGKLGDFAGDYEKSKKENKDEKNCSDDSDDRGWFGFLINIFFSPNDDKGNAASEPRESSPPKPAPYPYRDHRGLPMHSPDYREYSRHAETGYLHKVRFRLWL